MKKSKQSSNRPFDNPDALDTEKESIYDQEGMETVDPIPVEDLNQEMKEEKEKRKTKNDSSSEKRYNGR
ncbi:MULTISPECIES: hypothetical protein [Exiguobacterium]|uniref:hypothetical protein n=1 Tax=Exiguobacterium TaxID=33986 RepID=UPI001BE990F8|nr:MULTISPECIES: hypothetical protein [Exiguobacterium]MCT4782407.1 hypothetical protein [Exiguobacterium himgiriensis]